MKKFFTIYILLSTAANFVCAQQPNSWKQVNAVGYNALQYARPDGRKGAVGFSINGKGYIGTGINSDGAGTFYTSDFWEFDPVADRWTIKSSFNGIVREYALGFSYNGKGYIGLGRKESISNPYTYLNDLWEYNPASNTWTQISSNGPSLYNITEFVIGNIVYVIGTPPSGAGAVIYSYNLSTNTWTSLGTNLFNGYNNLFSSAYAFNGKGYLINLPTAYEYDPTTNTWTVKSNLPADYIPTTGFSIDSIAYLMVEDITAGLGSDGKPAILAYNMNSNTWLPAFNLPDVLGTRISGGGNAYLFEISFAINGKGFITTGRFQTYDDLGDINTNDGSRRIFEIDPVLQTMREKVAYHNYTYNNGISFTIGGKAYVGLTHSGYYSSFNCANMAIDNKPRTFWEYDPSTDIWTEKAPYPGNGGDGLSSFSINGKGYAGCGIDLIGSNYLNDFWEYDPVQDAWAPIASVGSFGRAYCSSFSLNGKGYVSVGNASVYNYLDDLWEYNPGSNVWQQKSNFGGLARGRASCFVADGKAYLGLGRNGSSFSLSDMWQYDPLLDAWNQVADYPGTATQSSIGFAINDKGFIATGYKRVSSSVYQNVKNLYEYDPVQNQWTQRASFGGDGRYGAFAFTLNNHAYVGGGRADVMNNTPLYYRVYSDVWEYTPAWFTGIDNNLNSSALELTVYPNPTTGICHITTGMPLSANITITNLIGETVGQYKIDNAAAATLNISHLAAGSYFIHLNTSTGAKAVKHLVLHK